MPTDEQRIEQEQAPPTESAAPPARPPEAQTPPAPAPAAEMPPAPAPEAQTPQAPAPAPPPAAQTPQAQAPAPAPAAEAPQAQAPAPQASETEVTEGEPEADPVALRERAAKADEYLALAQRTQADFENFRKRMTRDVRAAEARGVGRLARELLPALDNLERAAAALESSDHNLHLAEGIRLVTAELSAALGRAGITGYAAKGERFDPVHHEAVAQTPVEGAEPGTIVEVLQAGYRLNESVLRPARVVVAG